MFGRSIACLAVCAFAAGPLAAQVSNDSIAWEPERKSGGQVALELGVLAGGLSYARRVGLSRFLVGLGILGAWEPPATVEQAVLEPIGAMLFARYQPRDWLTADLGPAAMSYRTSDDCSTCSATFLGARATLMVGYRFIFAGPAVAAGSFRSRSRGTEFGMMYGGLVRIVFGG